MSSTIADSVTRVSGSPAICRSKTMTSRSRSTTGVTRRRGGGVDRRRFGAPSQSATPAALTDTDTERTARAHIIISLLLLLLLAAPVRCVSEF